MGSDAEMDRVKAMVQTVQALVQLHSPTGDTLRQTTGSMEGTKAQSSAVNRIIMVAYDSMALETCMIQSSDPRQLCSQMT